MPCHSCTAGHLSADEGQFPSWPTIAVGLFLQLPAAPYGQMPAPVLLLQCSDSFHCGPFRDFLQLRYGPFYFLQDLPPNLWPPYILYPWLRSFWIGLCRFSVGLHLFSPGPHVCHYLLMVTTTDMNATKTQQQRNGIFFVVRAEMLWTGRVNEESQSSELVSGLVT
jgi:hypothetical protein